METRYDYIICGAGASGCVLARRLSDNPDVSVLLLEAGGHADVASIANPAQWPENLGGSRDWWFVSEPNSALNGRRLQLSMGKVLGGGSSINALQWARGHDGDWDNFAEISGDSGWSAESVRSIYDRIEKRSNHRSSQENGEEDPGVHIEAAASDSAEVPVLVEAARGVGIPTFSLPNGDMVRGAGGASVMEVTVLNGKRHSVYRGYLEPVAGRTNLTVSTHATVTRLLFAGKRAVGVEAVTQDGVQMFTAHREIILSLGAVNTPKLLMQSGIGPAQQLQRFGIKVKQEISAVGENYQDHLLLFGCAWRFRQKGFFPNASRAVLQWKTASSLLVPNIQVNQTNGGTLKAEMLEAGLCPDQWWSVAPALIQPKSRGRLELTGKEANSPVSIFGNYLSEPDDLSSLVYGVKLCRDLAASSALQGRIGEELLPGPSHRDIEDFIRSRVGTFWHQSCTARMGAPDDSVVNAKLQVYGVESLRIADASILPRITAGNTMAPCVIIGERASQIIVETW